MSIRPLNDHYPTPVEFTRALFSVETFKGDIWEPCCGTGEMLLEIARLYTERHTFDEVYGSTIDTKEHLLEYGEGFVDYGYDSYMHLRIGNTSTTVTHDCDFLTDISSAHKSNVNIITNPPFKIADNIVKNALSIVHDGKVCMLLNVKYLTGGKRYKEIFKDSPPDRVWVFSDRKAMYPKLYTGKRGAPTENYAWYVWDRQSGKQNKKAPRVGWLMLKDFT